jgi:hypothetical protein
VDFFSYSRSPITLIETSEGANGGLFELLADVNGTLESLKLPHAQYGGSLVFADFPTVKPLRVQQNRITR